MTIGCIIVTGVLKLEFVTDIEADMLLDEFISFSVFSVNESIAIDEMSSEEGGTKSTELHSWNSVDDEICIMSVSADGVGEGPKISNI